MHPEPIVDSVKKPSNNQLRLSIFAPDCPHIVAAIHEANP